MMDGGPIEGYTEGIYTVRQGKSFFIFVVVSCFLSETRHRTLDLFSTLTPCTAHANQNLLGVKARV